jgi:site-specific DNA-cytosine methylase
VRLGVIRRRQGDRLSPPRTALELYSGIGGFAAAVQGQVRVLGAVDHDRLAESVYRANHPHPVHVRNLEFVRTDWLASFEADLWWLSPPCAPHGIRGAQGDLDDPRSASLLRLLGAIGEVRPAWVALENVPWFAGSRAQERLHEALAAAGYRWTEGCVCPSELGLPGVRRRYYLVASLGEVAAWPAPGGERRLLSAYLGPWRAELEVPAAVQQRFGEAFHVVDADDPEAVAACFTRAYGKSPVYVGSYLRQRHEGGEGVRYFAPEEIARLAGFPEGFQFAGLAPRPAWRLIGNSVSVDVVRWVLQAAGLPGR